MQERIHGRSKDLADELPPGRVAPKKLPPRGPAGAYTQVRGGYNPHALSRWSTDWGGVRLLVDPEGKP